MNTFYDAIVIGGGAAGSQAASFLAEHNWKTLLVEKSLKESFLGSHKTLKFYNSFPQHISGYDFLQKVYEKAKQAGLEQLDCSAQELKIDANQFTLGTERGPQHAKCVIVASGVTHKGSFVEGEKDFLGAGVFYTIISGASAAKGKTIAVVGKNEEAANTALELTRGARKIFFVIPSSKLDVSEEMQQQLTQSSKIELLFSSSPKKIEGNEEVQKLIILNQGAEKELEVSAVFPVGSSFEAKTDYLGSTLQKSEKGTLLVDENFSSSLSGVFACGDVLCGTPQIPSIAMAQGLVAGINAHQYLLSL
ncbi:MAG: hypothetical protein COV43_00055 [Deltaproteobacteria bacterium CG11_big_fil_rev_8_21_14_0_20_42_23]|nr:MAG: hypothetical protein COV43_00055 [Deltaproteobacteria bacterium CG11_big_fil_rev_8_21_14_0_20_42_23]PJC64858.1 MAG: hypothetical protein CO021_02135 [Deltaproteobacteria bacterium CG_4_9_14_0_2_um_filter_42_21]